MSGSDAVAAQQVCWVHMNWQELLARAETELHRGAYHDALQLCDRAAQQGEDARYHAAMLRGDTLLNLGDPFAALSTYEAVADPDVPDPRVDCARGIALLEQGRFAEARHALQSASRGAPELPDAYFYLGLLAELLGTGEESQFYRRARHIDPERFPPYVQLSRTGFAEAVEDALQQLPAELQQRAAELQVVIAELPHPGDIQETSMPIFPLTRGVFVGWASLRSDEQQAPPEDAPTLVLFKRNLERQAADREGLVAAIRDVAEHELERAF